MPSTNQKVTRFSQKANLSRERKIKYLGQLESSNLIQRHDDGDRLTSSITKQGEIILMEFLKREQFGEASGLDM